LNGGGALGDKAGTAVGGVEGVWRLRSEGQPRVDVDAVAPGLDGKDAGTGVLLLVVAF